MAIVGVVATAVWVMLPAYIPNNVAVVAGGGRPIDGGRTWRNDRLLGDGKTWRGTGVGIAAGVIMAAALNFLEPAMSARFGLSVPSFPLLASLALPFGAMLGDIGASFVKRRTGRARGAPFPVVDQLDFAVGALLVTGLVLPEWFLATFTPPVLLAVIVLTPVLHVSTNAVGYVIGVKQEPY